MYINIHKIVTFEMDLKLWRLIYFVIFKKKKNSHHLKKYIIILKSKLRLSK